MPTLIELSNEVFDLKEMLDDLPEDCDNHEEILKILEENLSRAEGSLEKKIEGYAAIVREYELRSEARFKESDRLAKRAESDLKKAQSLEEFMQYVMQKHGIQKIDGDRFQIRVCRNGGKAPVRINHESQIPAEFVKTQTISVPDMDKIRERLESGEEVPGAVLLERGFHLRTK